MNNMLNWPNDLIYHAFQFISHEWINIFQNTGFKILETKTNKDGLDRTGIEWLTIVVQK